MTSQASSSAAPSSSVPQSLTMISHQTATDDAATAIQASTAKWTCTQEISDLEQCIRRRQMDQESIKRLHRELNESIRKLESTKRKLDTKQDKISASLSRMKAELTEAKTKVASHQCESHSSEPNDKSLFRCFLASLKRQMLPARCIDSKPDHQGLLSMREITARAKLHDIAAHPILVARFLELGFTSEDLDACKNYIRGEAAIIVHFNAKSLLPHLLRDGVYRSAFETRRDYEPSLGVDFSDRAEWELSHLFYPLTTPDAQRCRYGHLHFNRGETGEPELHQWFGRSYFVLNRNAFKDKVSITPNCEDCSVMDTLQYCCRYLNSLSDTELKLLRLLTKTSECSGLSREIRRLRTVVHNEMWGNNVREAHIHAPIQASRGHIQEMWIPHRFKTDSAVLKNASALCERYKIQLRFSPASDVYCAVGDD